jgi:hypothetical protein
MNLPAQTHRSSLSLPVLSFLLGGLTLILGIGAGLFWLSYYFVFIGLILGVMNVASGIGTAIVGAAALEASDRGRGFTIAGVVTASIGLLSNLLCFMSLWIRA